MWMAAYEGKVKVMEKVRRLSSTTGSDGSVGARLVTLWGIVGSMLVTSLAVVRRHWLLFVISWGIVGCRLVTSLVIGIDFMGYCWFQVSEVRHS